jgi:hypothetical protein
MMVSKSTMTAAVAIASLFVAAAPAGAQSGSARDACATDPGFPLPGSCAYAAQALASTYPRLGIVAAGGNPTLGTASTGGVRLGFLPRANAAVRLTGARVQVPSITDPPGAIDSDGEEMAAALSLNLDASVSLFPGVSLAPTVGGFGALDLLASAGWMPLESLGGEGWKGSTTTWGVGARLGLLRESFTTPAVAASLMYRRVGEAQYGDVCPDARDEDGSCGVDAPLDGDAGQFTTGVQSWSARAVVSKRLLGLGLSGGVGYDRFQTSDASVEALGPIPGGVAYARRRVELEDSRFSVFAGASYALLVGSVTLEGGWMQGGAERAVANDVQMEHDPDAGTFFGSLGVRISL